MRQAAGGRRQATGGRQWNPRDAPPWARHREGFRLLPVASRLPPVACCLIWQNSRNAVVTPAVSAPPTPSPKPP